MTDQVADAESVRRAHAHGRARRSHGTAGNHAANSAHPPTHQTPLGDSTNEARPRVSARTRIAAEVLQPIPLPSIARMRTRTTTVRCGRTRETKPRSAWLSSNTRELSFTRGTALACETGRARGIHLNLAASSAYARGVLAVLAIVAPLGLDTFALSLALGAAGLPTRDRLRVTAILASFEAGMPLLGLAIGQLAGRVIGGWAELAAAGVLVCVGLLMLREDDAAEGEHASKITATHGLAVLGLGFSIAIDELAVGITLGLLDLNTPLLITLIAAQALIVAQIGLRLGTRLNQRWGELAEKLAGLALTAYGIYVIANHFA